MEILPRVEHLDDGAVGVLLIAAVARIHVEQVVADHRQRDQVGLDVDHPKDVVQIGLVEEQVVRGLSQHRRLVEADAGAGDAPEAGLELLVVPEVDSAAGEPDAVGHRDLKFYGG